MITFDKNVETARNVEESGTETSGYNIATQINAISATMDNQTGNLTPEAQINEKYAWIKNKHLTNPEKNGKKLGKRQGQTNNPNQTPQPQAKEKGARQTGTHCKQNGIPCYQLATGEMLIISEIIAEIRGGIRTNQPSDEHNPQAVRRLPPPYNTEDEATTCTNPSCNTSSRLSDRRQGRCPWCHKIMITLG